YVLMYAKDIKTVKVYKIPKTEKSLSEYNKQDKGGSYRLLRLRNTGVQFFNRETRPNLFFPIYVNPKTGDTSLIPNLNFPIEVLPTTDDGVEGCWTWGKDKINKNPGLIVGQKVRGGKWRIYRKDYLKDESLLTLPKSMLTGTEVNHEVGKEMLTKLFSAAPFEYPKSTELIASLVRIACKSDGIILDSFAGSGTTAHAVLALNKEDRGNRKFILVECEEYADTITAERVRRVINGVENAKDTTLKEGLGGSFTYCTLGKPIEIEAMLTGESLPSYSVLAAHLLFAAAGVSIGDEKLEKKNDDGLFYSDDKNDYYLHYQSDLDYLSSDEALLKQEHAERIRDTSRQNGKKAIVYAAGNYIGQRELTKMGITFCQLPYVLHER
ncbi:site-specific DNA-methyltransferase, partial [Candidatus Poribacteria bacterium]|nr:site-specific DNA-methyltransferase [Candidatus Poribacteria bacterium]